MRITASTVSASRLMSRKRKERVALTAVGSRTVSSAAQLAMIAGRGQSAFVARFA
ncbi:MAG: hypothetical protein JWM25_910 [Thermoleophilia bacterium]|nr:hypothetical protein [Thermoleophilia bacterium]